MKNIILKIAFTVTLLLPFLNHAQSLTDKEWIVAEYGISDNIKYGIDKNIKPLIVFFHKDSLKNKIDYSAIELIFNSDSSYQGKNLVGTVYKGKWFLNSKGDTLTTDTTKCRIDFINPFSCITNNRTIQMVDTTGTMDTLYSYIKLTGTDISTGTDYIENNHKAVVYPVPASDYINIQFNHIVKAKEARMYNVYGQSINIILLNGEKDLYRLDVKPLVPGYYILEVIDNSGKRIAMNGVVKQ